ncbi:MAG: GntR family transcriptional regulator [Rhizobacter sp.]|nr:GntR family transcriptional regulator [Rhizobacter sp.]
MTFKLTLKPGSTLRYVAIADAIAEAVAAKSLLPGARLPTHRALSQQLGLALATVTKGYAEAERQGLISSFVGRGTFVATTVDQSLQPRPGGVVDLAVHQIPTPRQGFDMRELLERVAATVRAEDLLSMQPSVGSARHRASGAHLLRSSGLATTADNVILCNGGQHAMLAIMASLHDRSGVVLTEHLTDPSLKAVATLLGRKLVGVPMDAHGMQMDLLDAACRRQSVALVVVTPNLHNPTNATMPVTRRAELAELARKHDFLILESDIYGVMRKEPLTPIASFAPERTLFVTSLAKVVGPGLKVGYIHAPPELVDQVASGLRLSTWMAAPIGAEIAHQLISEKRQLERLLQSQRQESAARAEIVAAAFGRANVQCDPASWHVWLRLPSTWRVDEFQHHTESLGIRVAPLGAFAVGRDVPTHAARLCTGAVSRDELESACSRLAGLVKKRPYLGFHTV